MPHCQEQTVSFSRFKLITLFILSICLVAGAAVLLILTANHAVLLREMALLRPMAILIAAAAAFTAMVLLTKILAGRPALVITDEGFYDASGGMHSGFIHWNAVEKIEQVRMAGQDFVVVFLDDPVAYLHQQSASWRRSLLALKNGAIGSPVVINVQGLDCSPKQLRQLMWDSYKLSRRGSWLQNRWS